MQSANTKHALLMSAIAAVGIGASALAGDHRDNDGAGNRIVGLWFTEGRVAVCDSGTPPRSVFNTIVFHANGTLTENARIPPNGVPAGEGMVLQRTSGLGTWEYDARKRTHYMHLRFDRYINNAYAGWTTVDREIVLSKGATMATGPVHVTNYSATGVSGVEECGEATATRL